MEQREEKFDSHNRHFNKVSRKYERDNGTQIRKGRVRCWQRTTLKQLIDSAHLRSEEDLYAAEDNYPQKANHIMYKRGCFFAWFWNH